MCVCVDILAGEGDKCLACYSVTKKILKIAVFYLNFIYKVAGDWFAVKLASIFHILLLIKLIKNLFYLRAKVKNFCFTRIENRKILNFEMIYFL